MGFELTKDGVFNSPITIAGDVIASSASDLTCLPGSTLFIRQRRTCFHALAVATALS